MIYPGRPRMSTKTLICERERKQERIVRGRDVSRGRVKGRSYVANFEDGERRHKPKDNGHPLEGKKKAREWKWTLPYIETSQSSTLQNCNVINLCCF